MISPGVGRRRLKTSAACAEHTALRVLRLCCAATGRARLFAALIGSISGAVGAANGSRVPPFALSPTGDPASELNLAAQSREPVDSSIREIDRLIDAGELEKARARLKQERAER